MTPVSAALERFRHVLSCVPRHVSGGWWRVFESVMSCGSFTHSYSGVRIRRLKRTAPSIAGTSEMLDVTMPREAATMQDPGGDLISRAVGGADRTWFCWTGRESVREFERTLGLAGRAMESFHSILDFGCGCGRMLLWMEELARRRVLHGTDIDADAIHWCREHVPYAHVAVNDADPPLRYPDGAFDLAFAHSVFTHLDEQRQDAWLSELQRVTSPGGFLVLSTRGEVALGHDVWRIRERLQDEGIVFIDNVFGPEYPLPDWYQRTFHARWYVFEHWGRWFEIRAYLPGGALGVQDQILLERRASDATPRQPLAGRDMPYSRQR